MTKWPAQETHNEQHKNTQTIEAQYSQKMGFGILLFIFFNDFLNDMYINSSTAMSEFLLWSSKFL